MKYVPQSYKLINLPILKKIELVGRVCYKSEDKIKEDSENGFIKGICTRGHTSVLEHGEIYFTMSSGFELFSTLMDIEETDRVEIFSYFKYKNIDGGKMFISTNLRTMYNISKYCTQAFLIHYFISEFLEIYPELKGFLEEPKGGILKHFGLQRTECLVPNLGIETFNIVCDRAIQNELVRHRNMSYTIESTRFCNYSKDKFEGGISIITPETMVENSTAELLYYDGCVDAEYNYKNLVDLGIPAEIARKVLPLGLKTELYMSGYVYNWNRVFKLRSAKSAHPEIRVLSMGMNQMLNEKYGGEIVPIF